MKKLVMLFIAITFFASFSLMGCSQPQEPPKPEPAKEGAAPAAPAPAPAPAPEAPAKK